VTIEHIDTGDGGENAWFTSRAAAVENTLRESIAALHGKMIYQIDNSRAQRNG